MYKKYLRLKVGIQNSEIDKPIVLNINRNIYGNKLSLYSKLNYDVNWFKFSSNKDFCQVTLYFLYSFKEFDVILKMICNLL